MGYLKERGVTKRKGGGKTRNEKRGMEEGWARGGRKQVNVGLETIKNKKIKK